MPFQLCSIAAFFYLITMITKSRRMFDFCYLSNIVGALIAVFLAAFTEDALCFWTVHYIQEHSFVIIVIITALTLGVFPRVDRRSVKPMLIGFSLYFLFCFVSGTAINVSTGGGYTVNYFYMFNLETAVSYVGFASFTGVLEVKILNMTAYPLLIALVYILFVSLCVGFYFLNRGIYALYDKLKYRKFGQPIKLKMS